MPSVKQCEQHDEAFLLDLVSGEVIAAVFRVTRRTLVNWRKTHGLPSVKIGDSRMYPWRKVKAWVNEPDKLLKALKDTPENETHP